MFLNFSLFLGGQPFSMLFFLYLLKDNYIELSLCINVQHAPALKQLQIWSNQGPRGSVVTTIGEMIFYIEYINTIFKHLLLKIYLTRKAKNFVETSWGI